MFPFLMMMTQSNLSRLVFVALCALPFGSACAQADNAPAEFTIHSLVTAPNPTRFGVNFSPASGGMDKTDNLIIAGGNANPADSRLSLPADADGTATTFVDIKEGGGSDFYDSVLSGYWNGAKAYTYRFENNAWTRLRVDTVAAFTAVTGSSKPEDHTITYAKVGPPTKKGDVVWLCKDAVPNLNWSTIPARFPHWDNFNGENSSGIERVEDAPPGDNWNLPGQPKGLSFKITDAKAEVGGLWQYIQNFNTKGNLESLEVGHTYRIHVWLRQQGVADGKVTFKMASIPDHTFTGVTGAWKEFTYDFPAPAPAEQNGPTVRLNFQAPGTVWMNNLLVYDTVRPPFTLNPQSLAALKQFHPGTIRFWSSFGNAGGGYSFWSLDSFLSPEDRGRDNIGVGAAGRNSTQQLHLPAALKLCKQLGADPWIIGNMSWSEEEWAHLMEFLGGPASSPYGKIRAAYGHPAPWTDDFPALYVEFGNEEWGTQSTAVNGHYGEYAHYMLSRAKAAPGWSPRIKFVVNGFTYGQEFGPKAAAACPEASVVDLFGYMGGGAGEDGFRNDLLSVPTGVGTAMDGAVARRDLEAAKGNKYSLAIYEGGPGADDPNAKGQGDNSLAAAVGGLDEFLHNSQSGFGPQNFFYFGMGTGTWTSHTNFSHGFIPHPVWLAYALRNQHCKGDMVAVGTDTAPTLAGNAAVKLASAYAFHDTAKGHDAADIVVISRDLQNATPVTLHLPAKPTGPATLYKLTGDPRDNNNTAQHIAIQTETIPAFGATYSFSLPAGSAYFFVVPTATWPVSGPRNLVAAAYTGQVNLSWKPTPGALSYSLYRVAKGAGAAPLEEATPFQTGLKAPQFVDKTVQNDTAYVYAVAATLPTGQSDMSLPALANPLSDKTVIQINCGGDAIPGTGWVADTDYKDGNVYKGNDGKVDTAGVKDAAPEQVYKDAHYGGSYTIPNLAPGGAYRVRLHFDETVNGPGGRIEDIAINGKVVAAAFDASATAGGIHKAVVRNFPARADENGQISITVSAAAATHDHNCYINGIEVIAGTPAPR